MQFIVLTNERYELVNANSKSHANRIVRNKYHPREWPLWVLPKQTITNTKNKMETATENLPVAIDKALLEQKKTAWGNFAVEVYKSELALQAKAKKSLAKIKIPTKIEEVIEAEKTLKEIIQDENALKAERKLTTSKFDTVIDRLMLPEKSFIQPKADLTNAIIKIKKADEEKRDAENKKKDELVKCREFLTTTKNNADAAFRTKILEKVNKVYAYALGDGNVELKELPELIKLALTKFTDVDFKIQYPLSTFSLIPTDEYIKMCNEILMIDSKPYLAHYENELNTKFSDYAVALHNKPQAIAALTAEVIKQTEVIKAETANANTAAKLNAIAVDAIPTPGLNVKALKQSYEVDMVENLQNSVIVMGAFVANIEIASNKLKVNKWDSFTIGQMKNAIAKCKCDDNAFAPAGIIFKTVDKL